MYGHGDKKQAFNIDRAFEVNPVIAPKLRNFAANRVPNIIIAFQCVRIGALHKWNPKSFRTGCSSPHTQAMYIVKCVQESKLEKPKYMVISDQGVCCSDVEGILPNPSPSLSEVVGEMLGLPQNLDFDRSILSKQGFAIYKALLNNENVLSKI